MGDDALEMSRTRFGYGSWDAPFWFLSIEEKDAGGGAGDLPNRGDLQQRIEAWRALGSRELDDCREFHLRIGEGRWHGEKAIHEPKWRSLILLLLAHQGRPSGNSNLIEYQRTRWGRHSGETCVIELNGIFAGAKETQTGRDAFLHERIQFIRAKLDEKKPRLLVLHGRNRQCQVAWADLTRSAETIEPGDFDFADLAWSEETLLAWVPAPTSFGLKNENWVALGKTLRQLADARSQNKIPGEQIGPLASAACTKEQEWSDGGGSSRGVGSLLRRWSELARRRPR